MIHAILDAPVRIAFEFPKPAPGLRVPVTAAPRLRALALRVLPKRRTSRLAPKYRILLIRKVIAWIKSARRGSRADVTDLAAS